jgi:hypothetical protein
MTTIAPKKIVFQFHELDREAKQTAIVEYSQSLDSSWYEPVYEEWSEKLKEKGYFDTQISFSGFHCQGDGAAFSGRFRFYDKEAEKWLSQEARDKLLVQRVTWKMDGYDPGSFIIGGGIEGGGHHCRMNMSLSDWDLYFYHSTPESEEFLDEMCEEFKEAPILEEARDLAQQIYKALEAEYEYLTSEEHVAEISSANDWLYSKKGNLL